MFCTSPALEPRAAAFSSSYTGGTPTTPICWTSSLNRKTVFTRGLCVCVAKRRRYARRRAGITKESCDVFATPTRYLLSLTYLPPLTTYPLPPTSPLTYLPFRTSQPPPPTSHLQPLISPLTPTILPHFTLPHTSHAHLTPLTSHFSSPIDRILFHKASNPILLSAEFHMRQRSSQPAGIGANRPKTIVAAVSATTRRRSLAVPSPRAYAVRWPRGGVRHGAQRAAQAPIPALVESFGSCSASFRAKLRPRSALEASLRGYRRPSYRGREVVTVAGVVGRAYHLLPMFYYARPAIPFSLLAEFYMRQRSSQPAGIGANRPKTIVAAVSATTRRHSLAVPGPRAYASEGLAEACVTGPRERPRPQSLL